MPAAQNDRQARVEALDFASHLHGLADHGAGHKGNRQAESVLQFFDYPLLETRRDRGIDNLYLVAGPQQRGGYSEDTQRRRRFLAGKGRKKEDDFLSLYRGSPSLYQDLLFRAVFG